jgi:capsular polysaccharide biosynthesis protein
MFQKVPAPAGIADSEPVLSMTLRQAGLDMSVQTLRSRVQATHLTRRVISITAQGNTARQAVTITNAVARNYLVYAGSRSALSARDRARMFVLSAAAIVPGTSLLSEVLATSGLGALCGALLGAIGAVALSLSRRRVRMT